MAEIVLGLAAPHNPNITSRPETMTDDVKHQVFTAFNRLQKALSQASPDTLVVLTSDHVTNFFYHNVPMFCIAVSDTCVGPAPKEIPELRIPQSTVKVNTSIAKGLLHYGIEHEIDFSFSEEMILDHAFMVPLSLLTPHMDLPIVPVHINTYCPPRPSARRCYKLGQQLGNFIRDQQKGKVAVLASGSFSGDIGGPKMGSVDVPFDMQFLDLVKEGKAEEMVRKTTPEVLEQAGVANELLVYAALLGVVGTLKPSFTDYICGERWSTAATLAVWNPK